jgi:hypothetical protein
MSMTKTGMGLAVIMMVLIGAFGAGCQEENTTKTTVNPEDKLNRVFSAENRRFKEQIEQQKEQLAGCVKEKEEIAKCEEIKKQLAKCEGDKETTEKRNTEEILQALIENSAKVSAENAGLKMEIAKLKGEVSSSAEPMTEVEPNQSVNEPASPAKRGEPEQIEAAPVETEPNEVQ